MTSASFDRPAGLAPKGSSWGLGLITAYAPGIPALTAMAASPWLPGGTENGLPVAMAAILIWAVIAVPLIVGFKTRRFWGVRLFFYTGVACAFALPMAILSLLILMVVTQNHRPVDFYYIVFGIGLIAMVPFWPKLIGALRLKYWQPWTHPDQWEVGDERIADWVFDAAGAPRRPVLNRGASRRPAIERKAKRRQ